MGAHTAYPEAVHYAKASEAILNEQQVHPVPLLVALVSENPRFNPPDDTNIILIGMKLRKKITV